MTKLQKENDLALEVDAFAVMKNDSISQQEVSQAQIFFLLKNWGGSSGWGVGTFQKSPKVSATPLPPRSPS